MKWSKKGHEFDDLYERIQSKSYFYVFGAGYFGIQLFHLMKNEIEIAGFIDNDSNKTGTEIDSVKVYSLNQIQKEAWAGIIIATSQFTRGAIMDQLGDAGYDLSYDVFILEQFISVYYVYKYNRIYFTNISLLPSTRCNLKCECCLNFNPYMKHFDVRKLEDIKRDIDMFFMCVDKVLLFHVSGGEPFLYPNLVEVIEYLDKNYRNQISTLRTVTNGTVVPKDEVLEALSGYDFDITVDDYREAVPNLAGNFDILMEKLNRYHIRYEINKVESWIDLAPMTTDHNKWSEEQLRQHFDTCCQSWQELRDGKLYSCNYDGYATVAGINPEQKEEVYNLNQFHQDRKKELVEFRLGYNDKGYTNLCRHCRGFHMDNQLSVPPAKQVEV